MLSWNGILSFTGVDQLDLATTVPVIAANTPGTNGTDSVSGAIKSHSITSGLISFGGTDSYTAPLTITTANLADVFGYLQANITGSDTVAFVASGNTFVFQDGGTAADTVVELLGVAGTTGVSTTAFVANSIWIV